MQRSIQTAPLQAQTPKQRKIWHTYSPETWRGAFTIKEYPMRITVSACLLYKHLLQESDDLTLYEFEITLQIAEQPAQKLGLYSYVSQGDHMWDNERFNMEYKWMYRGSVSKLALLAVRHAMSSYDAETQSSKIGIASGEVDDQVVDHHKLIASRKMSLN